MILMPSPAAPPQHWLLFAVVCENERVGGIFDVAQCDVGRLVSMFALEESDFFVFVLDV